MYRRIIFACGGLLLMGLTGCAGDGDFPTAPVTGQVLCQGQPVPHAMVYFEPLRTGKSALVGKPAFAMADENGNFVLGTYSLDDGAVIGRHRVRVDPPPPGKNSPGWTCPCEMDSNKDVMQVEVIDGENNFVIELPKASRRSRRSFDDEDEGEGDD